MLCNGIVINDSFFSFLDDQLFQISTLRQIVVQFIEIDFSKLPRLIFTNRKSLRLPSHYFYLLTNRHSSRFFLCFYLSTSTSLQSYSDFFSSINSFLQSGIFKSIYYSPTLVKRGLLSNKSLKLLRLAWKKSNSTFFVIVAVVSETLTLSVGKPFLCKTSRESTKTILRKEVRRCRDKIRRGRMTYPNL